MSYYQPNYYFGQNPITSQSGYQWQVSQQQEHAGRPNDGPHPTPQAFPVNGYDMNEDSDTSDTVEPVLVSASEKIMCPDGKRADHKTFMMRNVNVDNIQTMASFRKELHVQFGSKFINDSNEFDFGYYKGTKRLWVRNDSDLEELIKLLQTKSVTVWCDGQKKKRKISESSESDEEFHRMKKKKNKVDEKADKIDDLVDNLREKHGISYSNLQYRVWAETMVGGRHKSLDYPPKGSYFRQSRTPQSPNKSPVRSREAPTVIAPIKAAGLKSTYITQIRDLHSLLESGAISDQDFQKQKGIIMESMNKL